MRRYTFIDTKQLNSSPRDLTANEARALSQGSGNSHAEAVSAQMDEIIERIFEATVPGRTNLILYEFNLIPETEDRLKRLGYTIDRLETRLGSDELEIVIGW